MRRSNTCSAKITSQSSSELFATKKLVCICQPNSACIKQTNKSQVELLKWHRYNIETRGHSSAIDLPGTRGSTWQNYMVFFVGSLVEIETYYVGVPMERCEGILMRCKWYAALNHAPWVANLAWFQAIFCTQLWPKAATGGNCSSKAKYSHPFQLPYGRYFD